MVLTKFEILMRLSAKVQSFMDLQHIPKTLRGTSKFGKGLDVIVAVFEDVNIKGFTWEIAAKIGLGSIFLFASAPVALVYLVAVLNWDLATGATLTDNIGNYVNRKTRQMKNIFDYTYYRIAKFYFKRDGSDAITALLTLTLIMFLYFLNMFFVCFELLKIDINGNSTIFEKATILIVIFFFYLIKKNTKGDIQI